jgi:hypothetical protein
MDEYHKSMHIPASIFLFPAGKFVPTVYNGFLHYSPTTIKHTRLSTATDYTMERISGSNDTPSHGPIPSQLDD